MDDLRYLLRGLARTMRRHLRHARYSRFVRGMTLGVVAGLLMSLTWRHWLPPQIRQALRLLATGLFALWGVWLGARVGRAVMLALRFHRKMHTRRCDGLTLFYEATLESHGDALYQLALRTRQEAEAFLQTRLERQTRFVIIAHRETLSELRGDALDVGGWADTDWDDVYVVFYDLEHVYPSLLHEWTHLITTRWNEYAPPLFLEGIAVATEHHNKPQEAHAKALHHLRNSPNCSLAHLLDPQTFYDQNKRYAHYAWAGSFVLYLIEQFGLAQFRHFYERLGQGEIDILFQEVFGISLAQAERLWQEYLNTRMSESA